MQLKILILTTCVKLVICCSTFKDTEMTTILQEGTRYNLKLNGCVERIAFYQGNIERVIYEVHIKNQDVPALKRDSVRNMGQLRTFKITKSGVSRIYPAIFRNVPRLETIDFSENKLKELPYGVFNHTPITRLRLHHNQIYFIENNVFSDMPNLLELDMSYNELDAMNRNWFKNLPELETVDFRHNNIRTIPQKIFIHARKVSHIYFDYNDINEIQQIAFEGLTSLAYLGLKHNLLKRINENAFPSKFTNIQTLSINSNRFNFLSAKFLRRIKIDKINLDGNPWECSCFRKLAGSIHANGGKIVATPECENLNVPACVVPAISTDLCYERDDDSLSELYYAQVQDLQSTDCIRSLGTL